jgi:hypothetical protein
MVKPYRTGERRRRWLGDEAIHEVEWAVYTGCRWRSEWWPERDEDAPVDALERAMAEKKLRNVASRCGQ